MLAAMSFRRVPPLAVAFALIAAALVAALWVTRKTTNDAFAAARDGEALAVEQSVRADLPEGGPPDAAFLDDLLKDHAGEGLRYIAAIDQRGHELASAGTQIGAGVHGRLVHLRGRIRIELRAPYRRSWKSGARMIPQAARKETGHARMSIAAGTRSTCAMDNRSVPEGNDT